VNPPVGQNQGQKVYSVDRSLSRLLKSNRLKALEELETFTAARKRPTT
tara:strand:+ start:421 stop:564 length:144 start_codon:yes stop_codon:yes gene_type:complete